MTFSDPMMNGLAMTPVWEVWVEHASADRDWNNTIIEDCLVDSSGNGIRLIGPAVRLTLANKVMQPVGSPVTLWTKPGNTVGEVAVSGLNATGVCRSASSVT